MPARNAALQAALCRQDASVTLRAVVRLQCRLEASVTYNGCVEVQEEIRAFWLRHEVGAVRVVVGFSGGADSTALLHGLASVAPDLGVEVIAAHLHHGMRGEEADQDVEHCRAVAEGLGLEFVTEREDVPKLAEEWKIGIEEAGRNARYRFFETVVASQAAEFIATGHTADDHVETILMHVARGSGIGGLCGIRAYGRFSIRIRPILTVRRSETIEYCDSNSLQFLSDPTNNEMRFVRNRLRHVLRTNLVDVFGEELYNSIARLAEIARAEDLYILGDTLDAANELESPMHPIEAALNLPNHEYRIRFADLNELSLAIRRRLIRHLIRRFHPEPNISFELVESILSGRNTSFSVEGTLVRVVLTDEEVIFESEPFSEEVWQTPLTANTSLRITSMPVEILHWTGEPPTDVTLFRGTKAVFDRESVQGDLIVTKPASGEYIPLGFTGHRSVRDILSSEGIPRMLRGQLPMVSDDLGPIWVLGGRIADRVKVTDQTRECGYLEVKPAV